MLVYQIYSRVMLKLNSFPIRLLFIFSLLCLVYNASHAQFRLPKLITNHMVLQQQTTVKLWGWAKPGEKISITTSWNEKTAVAKADKEGK